MPTFSITESAFSGFGVISRKPIAILGWALAYLVWIVVVFMIAGGAFIGLIASVAGRGMGAASNPQVFMQMLAPLIGIGVLVALLGVLFGAILNCAVIRAVMEPESTGFAYLKLGGQEMWYAVNQLVQLVLIVILYIVLAIIFGIVSVATKGNGFVIFLLACGCVAVLWFFMLKFSLAGPISFVHHKFGLFDSWGATNGHTGGLFVVTLLLAVVMIGLFIANAIINGILNLGMGGGLVGAMQANPQLARNPMALISAMGPMLIVQLLIGAIFSGIYAAVLNAPFATAYRQLNPVSTQTAQAFA